MADCPPPFVPPPPRFTISAAPGTDIWRQPPQVDDRSGPTIWSTEHHKPVKAFISARVTFRARYSSQFDQAGLHLNILPPWQVIVPPKFIKAGVELVDGTPRLSSVACERYADWSLAGPLEHGHGAGGEEDKDDGGWVTILVERARSETGTSLNVYHIEKPAGADGEPEVRRTLREITWFYGYDEDWTVRIGAYAARPAKDAEGDLEVEFRDLVVQFGPIFDHPHHHPHPSQGPHPHPPRQE